MVYVLAPFFQHSVCRLDKREPTNDLWLITKPFSVNNAYVLVYAVWNDNNSLQPKGRGYFSGEGVSWARVFLGYSYCIKIKNENYALQTRKTHIKYQKYDFSVNYGNSTLPKKNLTCWNFLNEIFVITVSKSTRYTLSPSWEDFHADLDDVHFSVLVSTTHDRSGKLKVNVI